MENTESPSDVHPEKPSHKTLFIVIGFLAALVLLVALNMN